MAGNIKGITVDIGGNTGPLDKALKGVNQTSRDLQSELKQVEKLLKLDPTNTELLAQKQKLLTDTVGNTKEKLDTLKEAEKQVQEQFKEGKISEEQYRAFQRELIKTEGELKKTEEAARKTGDGFDYLGTKSEKVNDYMKKAGETVGAVAIAAGAASIKMAIDFDDSMAKVSTISDESEVPLEKLKQQIIKLSDQTGISATEIANNVYDAISAGQKTGDAVNFVTASTKLAKAGFAEAGQSLDVLTTILNAYGMKSDEVGKVSDILIQVQNKGKVTVGELSSEMGKIIPTANASNVSLEQLGAGYAIMTSKGIKAAEATTYMNGMLNELSKSGTVSSNALKNATGKSFQDLMKSGKSLSDVLEILQNTAKKNGKSLADMFGSSEAGKAALTLLSDGVGTFNNYVKDMNNSVGATDAAFQKLQTPGEALKKSLNELKNAGMELGDALTPVVKVVSDLIRWIVDNKSEVISALAGISAGLLAFNVVSMIQGLITALKGWQVATEGMTIAQKLLNLAMAANPIGLVITIIATLVTALMTLWYTNEDFRKAVIDIWDKVKNAFKVAIDAIIKALNAVVDFVKNNWQEILLFITNPIAGAIALLYKLNPQFKAWVDNLIANIKAWFVGMIDAGKNIVEGLWQGITNTKDWLLNKIKGFAHTITQGIKDFFGIHSPSAVMRDEVGIQIGAGIAEGINQSSKVVSKSAEQLAKDAVEAAKKAFDFSNNWIADRKYYDELSLKEELEAWERVQARYAEGTEEREKADKEVYRVKKELNDKLKSLEDDYYKKTAEINSKLKDDIKKVNDEYEKALNDRTKALYSANGLFDEVKKPEDVSGEQLVQNLQDQVVEFSVWQSNINELAKKGIDEGLIQELKDMGPKSAAQIQALVSLSSSKLNDYVTLWRVKHQQAKQQAESELEGLKKTTNEKIIELTKNASVELEKYKTEWKSKVNDLTTSTKDQLSSMTNDSLFTGVNLILNLINGIDAMKQPLQSKINEIQAMIRQISSGFSAIGGNSALNVAVAGAVGGVGLVSTNPIVKAATSLVINNNGTVVGTNGMKEFANTVSQVISGKFGLSIGGKF